MSETFHVLVRSDQFFKTLSYVRLNGSAISGLSLKMLPHSTFLTPLFRSSLNYFTILFEVWVLERGLAMLCSIVMLCTAALPGF